MKTKGIVYLLISIFAFASVNLFDKIGIGKGVDPSLFSFLRVFFSLCFVVAVWLALGKKSSLRFDMKHVKYIAVIGVLASGLGVVLMISALKYTTATNKGAIMSLYPVFTLIFAYSIMGEKMPKIFYPVMVTMILGLIMLTTKGFMQMPNNGDWLIFLTVPISGFCNSYAKKGMEKMDSLTMVVGRYIFGALFLLLLIPFLGMEGLSTIKYGFIWVLLSGIFSGLRVITFYKGIELEGPSIAALMISAVPAITALFEFFVLDEKFNILQIGGIILILVSAVLLTRITAQ